MSYTNVESRHISGFYFIVFSDSFFLSIEPPYTLLAECNT